jgi:hypothetical protein
MIEKCLKSDLDQAYKAMNHLWRLGRISNPLLFDLNALFIEQVIQLKIFFLSLCV